jgi:hypothetical protein
MVGTKLRSITAEPMGGQGRALGEGSLQVATSGADSAPGRGARFSLRLPGAQVVRLPAGPV